MSSTRMVSEFTKQSGQLEQHAVRCATCVMVHGGWTEAARSGQGRIGLGFDFGFFFVFGLHLLKHVKKLLFGKYAFLNQQLCNRIDLNGVGH